MRGARLVLTLVPLLLVTGCFDVPTGAESWEPPAEYRAWFGDTEGCSGLRGDFDRIEWYRVPGRSFECPGGQCAGHWTSNHSIYIAEDWVDHEMVVRHEMLHELLDREGHPDPPFGDPCPLTWETWAEASGAAAPEASFALRHID